MEYQNQFYNERKQGSADFLVGKLAEPCGMFGGKEKQTHEYVANFANPFQQNVALLHFLILSDENDTKNRVKIY